MPFSLSLSLFCLPAVLKNESLSFSIRRCCTNERWLLTKSWNYFLEIKGQRRKGGRREKLRFWHVTKLRYCFLQCVLYSMGKGDSSSHFSDEENVQKGRAHFGSRFGSLPPYHDATFGPASHFTRRVRTISAMRFFNLSPRRINDLKAATTRASCRFS